MSALTYRKAGLVARDQTRGLWLSLAIFVAFVGGGFLLVSALVVALDGFDGPGATSVWENSAYATRYYPLALGVMLTPVYLALGIANGVTRRTFSLGAMGTVVAIAGVMAVLEAVGYAVEDGFYRLAGLTQELTTPHLFDSGSQVWISAPEVWITVTGNVAAGWLIGTVYYRWGWLWPTLALPLTFAPALAVEALMSVGWPGGLMIDVWGIERGPLWLVMPASLLVIALTFALAHMLVRSAAVRPQV